MIYIGIDLGGTAVKIGAVSALGQVLGKAEKPTRAERPYGEVIRDMAEGIREILGQLNLPEDQIAAIGVGVPGAVNNDTGYVTDCTNLGWMNTDFRGEMHRYFSCPVILENDANVAALAEAKVGISKGTHSSIMITLGTGVGSAIMMDGKLWTGSHGVAGEIGHMILVPDGVACNCGRMGCVERYCSATALAEQARHYSLTYADTMILQMAGGKKENITAKMVVDAAREGDRLGVQLFTNYCRYLAMTIDNVINFFDPEMIILGGGVSKAGDFLLKGVLSYIPAYVMGAERAGTRVVLATLGNDAGIIGAALLGLK